jgi:hypothetical protein
LSLEGTEYVNLLENPIQCPQNDANFEALVRDGKLLVKCGK